MSWLGQLDNIKSRVRRSDCSGRAHVTLWNWGVGPVAPTSFLKCWPTVAAHQLLHWHTMMVCRKPKPLIRASRVLPLSILIQSQTTVQGSFLAGFAAVSQGVIQRSDIWDVEGLWRKVNQSCHCHTVTPLNAGDLGHFACRTVDQSPGASPPIPSSGYYAAW